MTPSRMNPQVDHYLAEGCGRCPLYQTPDCKVHSWRDILHALREVVQHEKITEEYKWSQPCYTLDGANLFIVTAFKNYAAIAFFKGSLFEDPHQLLIVPGEHSRHGRQLRFTSLEQVYAHKDQILFFVLESIRVQEAGLEVPPASSDHELPQELTEMFQSDPAFEQAFFALTPGRQRGYIIYFSQAKQPKTRVSRIEKYRALIFSGMGMHDEYKKSQKKNL